MKVMWLLGVMLTTGFVIAEEPQDAPSPVVAALIDLAKNPGRQIPIVVSSLQEQIPSGAIVRLSSQAMAVDEIIGPGTAIIFGRSIWADGISTDTIGEGSVLQMDPSIVWYCHGNKRYKTVIGGTKTLKHLEVITSPRIVAEANRRLAPLGKRLWLYSAIDRKTRAKTVRIASGEFVRKTTSRVYIKTDGGKTLSIRIVDLSESDQSFVASQ